MEGREGREGALGTGSERCRSEEGREGGTLGTDMEGEG
jgi:hypothetical protein